MVCRGPQQSTPMTRRLLNVLTLLSLLLCVAVCALWLRSYRVGDWLLHTHDVRGGVGHFVTEWAACSNEGRIQLCRLSCTQGFGTTLYEGMREGWQREEVPPAARYSAAGRAGGVGFAFDFDEYGREVDDGRRVVAIRPVKTA